MKKILSLLTMLVLSIGASWAGETFTYTLNGSEVSSPSSFFTHDTSGKFSFNTKFNGASYAGVTFTSGLKMEGTTKILFTTTETSTVTIVQSTWSNTGIKLDDQALESSSATAGTGYRVYTVTDVNAGPHNITRGSFSESGLFYVKVEYADKPKTVTFINDQDWTEVAIWAWNSTENFTGGTWPGTPMTKSEEQVDGHDVYTWQTTGNPTSVIFNNNVVENTSQTETLEFVDGGRYNFSGRIIELNNYTVTFTTEEDWTNVKAYTWSGEGSGKVEHLGAFPGTAMTYENGVFSITVQSEEAPTYVIFSKIDNDNVIEKTPDWAFEANNEYSYFRNTYTASFTTDAEWETVKAYVWSGDGEAATNKALGEWPGTELTATDGVYNISFKAFDIPEKILFYGGSNDNKTPNLNFIQGKAYKWITATPLYILTKDETFKAGTTVPVNDADGYLVATLTYGVSGGADFGAATNGTGPNEDYKGFSYYTPGNGQNGTETSGTVYTIVPLFDGTITVGVRLNGGKNFYIKEDGESMAGYDGITIPEAANTSYSFPVKANSTYKIYCTGSKLGFFGFDYKFTKPADLEYEYAVVGCSWDSKNEVQSALFAGSKAWDTNTTDVMTKQGDGTYVWSKNNVELPAQWIDLKVVARIGENVVKWFGNGDANVGLNINETGEGLYNVTVTFDGSAVTATAEKQPTATVYFVNTNDWAAENIKIWVWDANNNDYNYTGGDWNNQPTMTATGEQIDGKNVYTWSTYELNPTPTTLIISNNGSETERTGNQAFVDGATYKADGSATVTKTISTAEFATYCSESALDFSESGLTAYIAKVEGGKIKFYEVTTVPANTGVLLKGAAGEHTIKAVASSETDVEGNKLFGVTKKSVINKEGIYVLMSGTAGVAFYKTTTPSFTVSAHSAYIDVTSEARVISFEEGGTTAIDVRGKMEDVRGDFFNIAGQRVAKPTKGLYIVNGKKVVVK